MLLINVRMPFTPDAKASGETVREMFLAEAQERGFAL